MRVRFLLCMRDRNGRSEAAMTALKRYLRHTFNPLHVYCRLCDWGWNDAVARGVSRFYERAIYRRLSPGVVGERSCPLR